MAGCQQRRKPRHGSKITAALIAVPLLAYLFAAQAKDTGRHCPSCKGDLPDIRGMAVRALDPEAVAFVAAFLDGSAAGQGSF